MIWYGISGSWRKTNKQVEFDVRYTVKEIIENGNGIVTGGALNVDFFTTDEAMKINPSGKQIKVIIPCSLETYSFHYRKRAMEGVILPAQAESLITQLSQLKMANRDSFIEMNNDQVDQTSYYKRNTAVVDASDELYAFQVNQSAGMQDTIDKAKKKGIPIHLFSYTIE